MDAFLHYYMSDLRSRRNTDNSLNKVERTVGYETEKLSIEVENLQHSVDKLSLACSAMWELIKDNTSITQEDLLVKMTEIDLKDGKLDGKMGIQILTCPECGRKNNSKRDLCLYCGHSLPKSNTFG